MFTVNCKCGTFTGIVNDIPLAGLIVTINTNRITWFVACIEKSV